MTNDHRFPIVGIGASAGGLKALEGLLPGLPTDTGMAFVIITHLPPGRVSTLSEILARSTSMPVVVAEDGAVVEPNHVYVSPPDRVVKLADGRLKLAVPEPEFHRFPIDQFLLSLADHSAEHAIGILLSGGGTDGSLGVRAIKDHGGLTLAQGHDGSGPLHTGMPNTAIATGAIDIVVPVERMGARLAELARSLAQGEAALATAEDAGAPKSLTELSRILFKQLGHDFSGYKPKTFMRRVRRRMQVHELNSIEAYIARLREDPEEVTQLFRDLLIGVTSFFRDPAAFAALEEHVIPHLFEGKGAGDSVRIWVPGCATGEEAYSIAIMLRERMDKLRASPKVQIFATDIDEGALLVARVGRYSASSTANVSPERLQRFFAVEDGNYTISKEIREMCAFSLHNVLHDPPFSRVDLISCRNLLIYFGPEFQARVLPIFHFALKQSGYLFLGTSENVSQHGELFSMLDKKQRIFQRRNQVPTPLEFPRFTLTVPVTSAAFAGRAAAGTILANLRGVVEGRVMEHFAPAHVVVNRDGDVLYYSARTGKYLEQPAGLPNQQLMAMARKGLRIELRAALREAYETRRMVERSRVMFDVDGSGQCVNLVVEPFGESEHEPLFLVLFQDVVETPTPPAALGANKNEKAFDRLEQDLRETRERLQMTVEEYETAVEELKSSNEELQSINEELQSTNEEMETSKEELQSVNEELNTVNAELNSKVEELDRAHADLRNVFDSTQIAMVFLDRQLAIRSFTPAATAVFKLISSDRGRPLTDIATKLVETGDLRRDTQMVIERGEPIERRVQHADGRTHYFMRLLPYRGDKGAIEGALVVLLDVTRLVDSEAQQRVLLQELNSRVKRTLGVLASFIEETPEAGRATSHFADVLLGRIRSMAKCYDLLERANWGDVELHDILAGEIDAYRQKDKDRVFIDGPPVNFKPPGVLALGMALHELAAESAESGALADPKGSLSITWDIVQDSRRLLHIDWTESGRVRERTPRPFPLGTEFIDRELKVVLKAKVVSEQLDAGWHVRITIPLNGLAATPPAQ